MPNNYMLGKGNKFYYEFIQGKKIIVFSILLLVFIAFIDDLSGFGFVFTEFVANRPEISYVSAVFLPIFGFTYSFRCLSKSGSCCVELAIRIYTFFGLGMSGIYYLLYISHIGCFKLPPDILETAPSLLDFIYFSFVTVTTVGYGDIVPNHTFVRIMVLTQVLFGMYLLLRVTRKTS